jgi:hypothetical protein
MTSLTPTLVPALAFASGDEAVAALAGFLDRVILSNPIHAWLTAAAIVVGLIAGFMLLRSVLLHRLRKIAERTSTQFDDVFVKVLEDQRTWLFFFVAVFIGSRWLSAPVSTGPDASSQQMISVILVGLQYLAVIAVASQLFLSSRLVVDFGLEVLLSRSKTADGKPDPGIRGSLVVLRFVIMLIVGVGVVLLALENFGVKVGPMITGLGIGGIAIALAVQKVLGDVLASVSILMDKPFVVGDTVQVGDKTGTVETIGIKTTRLKAPTGEQLIFGNADILSSRIHNYQRMEQRRVTFSLGVIYELSPEKLRSVPQIIQRVIESKPDLQFDRCHLKSFGDWAINFETSYLVKTNDYKVHMDSQQAVLLEVFEAFSREKIDFAYPTQVTRTTTH